MEKYAWSATIKDGMKEEYIRRHKNISQEMKDVLKEAGIKNYSIWLSGNTLFGYYECEKGIEFAAEVQKKSKVVDDWNIFMKDVMEMKMEDNGAQPHLEQVFDFN